MENFVADDILARATSEVFGNDSNIYTNYDSEEVLDTTDDIYGDFDGHYDRLLNTPVDETAPVEETAPFEANRSEQHLSGIAFLAGLHIPPAVDMSMTDDFYDSDDNDDQIVGNNTTWKLHEPLNATNIEQDYVYTMEALRINMNGSNARPRCIGLIRRKSNTNREKGERCRQRSYYKIGVQLCFQHYKTLLNLRYQPDGNLLVSPLYPIIGFRGFGQFSLLEQLLIKTKQLYRGIDIYHKIIRDEIKTDSARDFIKVIEFQGIYYIVTDMYLNIKKRDSSENNDADDDEENTIYVFSPNVIDPDPKKVNYAALLIRIYKHVIMQRDRLHERVFGPTTNNHIPIGVYFVLNTNANLMYTSIDPSWYDTDVSGLAAVAMVKSIATGVNPASRFFFNLMDHIMDILLTDRNRKHFSKKNYYTVYHVSGTICSNVYIIDQHISIKNVKLKKVSVADNADLDSIHDFRRREWARYTKDYDINSPLINFGNYPLYLHPCNMSSVLTDLRVISPDLMDRFVTYFDSRYENARLEHEPVTQEEKGILILGNSDDEQPWENFYEEFR